MPGTATQYAARPIRDAVNRLLRGQQPGRLALGLHLSRLLPAPRLHHRRIARALLEDAAARREGQLFWLANGDLLLLFAASDCGASLATLLARLFKVDAPNPGLLLSRWLLPADAEELLAYLDDVSALAGAGLVSDGAPEPGRALPGPVVARPPNPAPLAEKLGRQTAVLVGPLGSARLRPLFRELGPGPTAASEADPFPARADDGACEQRFLATAAADMRRRGTLLAWALDGRLELHVNLGPQAILTPSFDAFAAACNTSGTRACIEVALPEAGADPDSFLLARDRLRAAGLGFVLDAVSLHALLITRPASLEPDLVKLDWCRQMPESGEPLAHALQALGPARVLLNRADGEDALRWGMAHGIRRFQGKHVDAMLAVSRLATCLHAPNCTLRQCTEREASTSAVTRGGCRNHDLLDAAAGGQELPC